MNLTTYLVIFNQIRKAKVVNKGIFSIIVVGFLTCNLLTRIKSIAPMKTHLIKKFPIVILLLFIFSSCLTVETKNYTFTLTGNNSGKLIIKYTNIYSTSDDGKDVSTEDFKELIDNYLKKEQFIKDYPLATNIQTKLFEENGVLCGELTLDFPDLNAARLYQYDAKSPIMMCITSAYDSESFKSTNGNYGNEHMPVVFWPTGTKKLELTTAVSTPDESSVSLIDLYRIWLETQQ